MNIEQFITNTLSNEQTGIFLSGLLVPILLYVLTTTSFTDFVNKLTFWKWQKTTKLAGFIGLIILVNVIILISLFSNKTNSPDSQTTTNQTQHTGMTPMAMNGLPGMDGDKTKRYAVSFLHPEQIKPDQEVTLTFRINDANSGNPTLLFKIFYEKIAHLIIVDKQLEYFTHIHPSQEGNTLMITTKFPKAGQYHLYLDFLPWGAIEQQFAFTITVGENKTLIKSQAKPDTNLTKTFDGYDITLATPQMNASEMSRGEKKLTFILKNTKTKEPVTNLQPYLGSFGHLVMINQETFDYVHIHPATTVKPIQPDSLGGPEVTFLPMAIYAPFKPGIYRAFAQFNPDGKLVIADFTVEIK